MKNNKGFSLTELLVTIAILTIMSGIAVVSYNSYIPEVKKRKLCDSAILFAVGAKTCIMNIGGWESYNKACDPTVDPPDNDQFKENLEQKLDYKCPDKADCEGEESGDYYCLRIKKDKYHIFIHFHTDKLDYKVHSGESASVIDIDCKEAPTTYSFESNTECPKH